MHIRMQNITPAHLAGVIHENTQLWQQDVTFAPGTTYLIHAVSGSGKTTLTRLLYGLPMNYSGTLFWGQEAVSSLTPNQVAAVRQTQLSIVFQDLRLFDNLTAAQNIEVNRVLAPAVSQEEALEMARSLGLAALLDKPVANLSQGEKQRVAIVRSLVQPFEWLLLDEPFSHLDDQNIEKAKTLIMAQCQKQNAGMLFCSLGSDYQISFQQRLRL